MKMIIKIKDKVLFTGYYPAEKLYAAYKRADLFVLPSIIEGFGLTVVEHGCMKNVES
ncbi:MAG: glycosyltransferase [Thermoplasmata archaeon]|jgi:glycosyltransferase involved in cell wall biosynthesis